MTTVVSFPIPESFISVFELLFRENVANHGVAELRMPGPGDRARNVAFIVSLGIDVHFDHADIRILRVLRHPIRTDQNFSDERIDLDHPWSSLVQARSNFS